MFEEPIKTVFLNCYLLIREIESGKFLQKYMADTTLINSINPSFFEGVEKLLEIWFAPNPNADLRKIPR